MLESPHLPQRAGGFTSPERSAVGTSAHPWLLVSAGEKCASVASPNRAEPQDAPHPHRYLNSSGWAAVRNFT